MPQDTTQPNTPPNTPPSAPSTDEKPLANDPAWIGGLRDLYRNEALAGTDGKEEDRDGYHGE